MIKKALSFFFFCLQPLLLLLFVFPAAEQGVNNLNNAQQVTLATAQSPAASRLYFGKGLSTVSVGETQTIGVLVDTAGANLGGASLDISVPAHLIKLESLSFDRSFCTTVVKENVNAAAGTAHAECTAPNPGLRTQIGTVVAVAYTPLQSGTADFHINAATAALPTNTHPSFNALKSTEDTLITVTGGSEATSVHIPLISTTAERNAPCSSLHEAQFQWLAPDGVTSFEYELNDNPTAITTPVQTNKTSVTVATQAGTHYFHVRATGASTLSTLAVTTCE